MIQRITATQTKILVELANYKFLTTSQMIVLGIANNRANLHKDLVRLREGKQALIGQISLGTIPKIGKIENIYFLTKKGVEVLENDLNLEPQSIKAPIGTSTLFSQDYFHRKNTIDCEIALNLSLEKYNLDVLFFDRYFDKVGANRSKGNLQAKTKIDLEGKRFLIADAVFMLQTPLQQELYCFEMYNQHECHIKRHL